MMTKFLKVIEKVLACKRQVFVRDLLQAKVFEKRGAVSTVARMMGVTPLTIYNDLKLLV
jgi:predicted transcriptional regulator YheO